MKGLMIRAEWAPRGGYKPTPYEEETHTTNDANLTYYNPQFALEELPVPSIKRDEVLLKVGACGICGTDVHLRETDKDNYAFYNGHVRFPVVIGHEFSGEVVEVGSDVKDLRAGDLVACEEMNWCGECTPCRSGIPNQCERLEELGLTINGGLEEYVAVKAKYCWKLNDLAEKYGNKDKAFEAGALVEPTGVAYNGLFARAGGFPPGTDVVIFGAGPVGLGLITLSRAAGAAKIIAFERPGPRAIMAREFGADYVFDIDELEKAGSSAEEAIMEVTKGAGAGMMVEAAGDSMRTVPIIANCLSVWGKGVQIGWNPGKPALSLSPFQYKGAQLYGSSGHAGHGIFPNVIKLMAAGRIDMRPIITARFPLSQALEAVDKQRQRDGGKVIVKPGM